MASHFAPQSHSNADLDILLQRIRFLKNMIIDFIQGTFQAHVLCINACCLSAFVIDTEPGLLCSAWNGKEPRVSFQLIPSPLPGGLCSSFHGLNKSLEGLHWLVYGRAVCIISDQS